MPRLAAAPVGAVAGIVVVAHLVPAAVPGALPSVPETTSIGLISGRTAPWADIGPALRELGMTPSAGST